MSLLLKALKQAETANAGKPGLDLAAADLQVEGDLELEPSLPGTAKAREWVEPPGLLFGNGTHAAPPAPRWRLPRLSLVPLTALIAAVIAVGYGVYLYFELQPQTPTNTPAVQVSAAPPLSVPIAPPIQPAPAPLLPAIDKPAATAPSQPQLPEAPVPVAPPARSPEDAITTRAQAPALPRFQPDLQSALLAQGYAAYERGSLVEAQRLYTQAAARHRGADALLGLAAVAVAQGRDADAQHLYREVLDIDPRNAEAQGALLDLLGSTDTPAAESRLKALIDREPSAHLYQSLGNLYANQGRWNDAQAAYFEAWRSAPANADYAYNLAVSLDQLGERAAALTYYQKALASGSVHRFDRGAAEARVQQLKPAH